MKKAIFLSYSSSPSEAATRVELSLKGEGHSVFRDRSALPPGESFDARIRAAIQESDLFIFLISRESVLEGRYTLTELKFAEQKWGHPAGHVLPVLTEPVPKEAIPEFLRAVTMLQPRGDLAAEVTAEVDRMTEPWWRWFLRPQGLALLVLVALLIAGSVWQKANAPRTCWLTWDGGTSCGCAKESAGSTPPSTIAARLKSTRATSSRTRCGASRS
jgi:hypothetical protein